ncbi:ABC transporter ATP-binding protein [Enterococcus timonensis]|uniref:ABC transporter ATP-binding protein n=1 Tax=Enterococcus timonensis TaxID=1852364 RepID=UPI0008DB0754|nr:ABC transporter ATP-binding protein [Enterococcus timonensis]
MLEVTDLHFSYGKKEILAGVSFDLTAGEIVGLVAPNGTGKSTLLRSLTGLLTTKKGQVRLLDFDRRKNRNDFLQHLFFLEDSTRLFDHLTAKEHFQYVKDLWSSKVEVKKVLQVLRMQEYAKKKVGKMSLGMKQHVLLGMYLMSDADLLLFDEPLNGLDPTSIDLFTDIFSRLKSQGKTMLMSSHQLGNVSEMSDRVIFLKEGQIEIFPAKDLDLAEKYRSLFSLESEVQLW